MIYSEPIRTWDWHPKLKAKRTENPKLKPKVLGLMGRDDPTYEVNEASGLGVIIDIEALNKINFEVDKEGSSNWEWYSHLQCSSLVGFNKLPI